jgi:hypothetical protein
MKKLEWPGIATAAGIILALAIIVAASRDDFHLKDWQPLMAALIALGGGALAYRGAMAKIDADRDTERRAIERKKLAIYYRLGHAIFDVQDRVRMARVIQVMQPFEKADLVIEAPPEVAEAWKSLELLPRDVLDHLDSALQAFYQIGKAVDNIPDELQFPMARMYTYEDPFFEDYRTALTSLGDACEEMLPKLVAAMNQLKPDA